MAFGTLYSDRDHRRREPYKIFAGNGHVQATFTPFIIIHSSLMESIISHPRTTLLDAAMCTLVVNYWSCTL